MSYYAGRKAKVKYGQVYLTADNYQYQSTAKAIESPNIKTLGTWEGDLDATYEPRKDPLFPDMANYPSGDPSDNSKRFAMHGVVPHQIFGGVRRGTISMEGPYGGPLLMPRVGNLVTVQLFHLNASQTHGFVTGTVMVTESSLTTGVRGYLRWTIKGDFHGDFDVAAS